MAVTRELLAHVKSLDDLLELAVELGYQGGADELNPAAWPRLGLDVGGLGTRRAAIVGRRGAFVLYGLVADAPSRPRVTALAQRLGRATPGERNLLFVLDSPATTLAIAAPAPGNAPQAVHQLRIRLPDPSPVAAEILQGLVPKPGDSTLGLAVRAADVLAEEGLTSRFFGEFERLHVRAAEALDPMPRATLADRRALALVILTRVLFLYFVQAKGWLAGRRDFLPSLLDTALGRGHPFHRSVFEPLCFGALNTPPTMRSRVARALGAVPFLNGGLFERHPLERRFPRAELSDAVWRQLFDELFERFHFTVSDRDDQDAVDPEMLGRVFEGVMSRDRRRRSGTFFTPRELVRETVSQALRAATASRGAEALRNIRVLDPAVGSGAFLLEALAQLERLRIEHGTTEGPTALRRAIVRDSLFGVDADPMAVRLAELRLWLALVTDDDATPGVVAPLPNLDQNLRQGDSLLSPLDAASATRPPDAVRHALAVGEHRLAYFAATGRAKADLARAIRDDERSLALETADAAIGNLTARLRDAAAGAGRDLFGARARRTPTSERRVARWRRQRRELLAARRRIAAEDALPFFAYDVHFGHVMAAGGFDVIVGNPPWIRGERVPAATRIELEQRYECYRAAAAQRRGFAHLPDVSVAFVERALTLVRPEGVVGFILPAKLLRAGYAGPLRALLRRTATVVALRDLAHGPAVGFAATVFPLICILRRIPPDAEAIAEVSTATASGRVLEGKATQRELALDEVASRAPWLGLPGDLVRAVRAALRAGPRLGAMHRPVLGIKTGANEVFIRAAERADALPRSCRVPAILGRDVSPFAVRPSATLLAALADDGTPLPRAPDDVAAFLEPLKGRLARRADARGQPAWALFRTDVWRARWLVIWRDIAGQLEAAPLHRTSRHAPVPLNTCYGIAVADERTALWLSAFLNSRTIRSLASALAERASGGAFRFSAHTVASLPLPAHSASRHVLAMESLAREAVRGEPWDQDELDTYARAALDLTPDTAALIELLGDALRRNAVGDRRPALSSADAR